MARGIFLKEERRMNDYNNIKNVYNKSDIDKDDLTQKQDYFNSMAAKAQSDSVTEQLCLFGLGVFVYDREPTTENFEMLQEHRKIYLEEVVPEMETRGASANQKELQQTYELLYHQVLASKLEQEGKIYAEKKEYGKLCNHLEGVMEISFQFSTDERIQRCLGRIFLADGINEKLDVDASAKSGLIKAISDKWYGIFGQVPSPHRPTVMETSEKRNHIIKCVLAIVAAIILFQPAVATFVGANIGSALILVAAVAVIISFCLAGILGPVVVLVLVVIWALIWEKIPEAIQLVLSKYGIAGVVVIGAIYLVITAVKAFAENQKNEKYINSAQFEERQSKSRAHRKQYEVPLNKYVKGCDTAKQKVQEVVNGIIEASETEEEKKVQRELMLKICKYIDEIKNRYQRFLDSTKY